MPAFFRLHISGIALGGRGTAMNTKTTWIIALAVIGASVAGASITLEFPVASTNAGTARLQISSDVITCNFSVDGSGNVTLGYRGGFHGCHCLQYRHQFGFDGGGPALPPPEDRKLNSSDFQATLTNAADWPEVTQRVRLAS